MEKYNRYKFRIVLPAKNETRNIPFVINQLLQKHEADKITAVLDGDIELTARILAGENVRFIQGPNKGKGAAMRAAIEPTSLFLWIQTALITRMKSKAC